MNVQQQFEDACSNGNFDKAKILLQNNSTINVSNNNKCAFQLACENGHLNVAQWLLQIKPTINVSACDDKAFNDACFFNYCDIVYWLNYIKPNINFSEWTFQHVCQKKYLRIAILLCKLNPF
jgi:ankyrin repeat protein